MSKSQQNLKQLEDKLKQLDKLSRQLGKNSTNFATSLKDVEKHADTINLHFDSLTSQVEALDTSFQSLTSELGTIAQSTNKFGSAIEKNKRTLSSTVDIARDYQSYQKGNLRLSSDELKSLQSKLTKNKQHLNDLAEDIKSRNKLGNSISKQGIDRLVKLGKINAEEAAILKLQRSGFSNVKDINNGLSREIKNREKIEGVLSGTDAILNGISKIPILGDAIGADKVLKDMNDAAEDGGDSLTVMGAGLKSMGKNIGSWFMSPLSSITLLVKGFQELLKLGFQFDAQTTQLSKSMGVSKEAAGIMRDRMAEIQETSDNVYMTVKNQVEAQFQLADALGVTMGITEKMKEDQVTMTKNMGLSAEEAGNLQKIMQSSGKDLDYMQTTVVKESMALFKQKGIRLDNKKIMQDMAKASGDLRRQYQDNPKLLAQAVVQAQQLGIEMSKAASMAEGLLDFEKSIENELAAELLTGKDLNLERARGLALANKPLEAAKEMMSQISATEFKNMNPIAAEGMAQAMNMTRDELAQSLFHAENLKNLGSKTREQLEAQAQALRDSGREQEALALLSGATSEAKAKEAMNAISEQEKFNEGIEKMKAILGELMAGPAQDLAKWIAGMLKHTTLIKGVFVAIGAILAGKIVASLGSAIIKTVAWASASATQAIAAISSASAATLGIAIPSIIGGLLAGGAAMYGIMKANDMVMSGDGGGGYGKRTLLGPEGAIQLNNKDTVIAGTNLFGDDVKSQPGKSTEFEKEGSIKAKNVTKIDLTETNNAIRETNKKLSKLIALASTPKVNYMGLEISGQKVGEAIMEEEREIQ